MNFRQYHSTKLASTDESASADEISLKDKHHNISQAEF